MELELYPQSDMDLNWVILNWLMTPTSSIEFSESSFSGLNFGNSVKLGTIAELSLDGGIEYESSGKVSRKLRVHGRKYW